MERASRLIGRLKLPGGLVSAEDRACAAWPLAVGKKIARHTNAVKLVRSTLVIEAEDVIWQRQLNTLRHQIVSRLREVMGDGTVTDLDFRPMIPRRLPQRAEKAHTIADEAELIQDPVLERLYKDSRKKASA